MFGRRGYISTAVVLASVNALGASKCEMYALCEAGGVEYTRWIELLIPREEFPLGAALAHHEPLAIRGPLAPRSRTQAFV